MRGRRRLSHTDFKSARRSYVCNFCLKRYEVQNKTKLPLHCQCGAKDWIHFQSRSEANRYSQLRLSESKGAIKDLKLQPRFNLLAAGLGGPVIVGTFTADFEYWEGGNKVIEDTKGFMGMTDMASWKHRHFHAQFGFEVRVVKMR